ncbi:MAG: hypothetical protein Q8P13_00470 [bacterium]|nr:hypothetical protein [bacterium]
MFKKGLLQKLLFGYLLVFFSLVSAVPALAVEADPTQLNLSTQTKTSNQALPSYQNTNDETNSSSSLTDSSTALAPSDQRAELPGILNPCKAPGIGKACGAVQDAYNGVTDLPGTIFGWLKGNIVDLFYLAVQGGIAVALKIMGKSVCTIPLIDLPFCNNNAFLNSPDEYNVFMVADIAIGGVYKAIPYQSPGSYVADALKDNLLGIGSANAQGGVGPDSIDTAIVKDTWAKARQLALIFMVLVMLAISVMIIFRRRLPDKNVVSVLNSLPRVVLALFLIVFSFAISGLFLDFIFLSVNIVRDYYSNGVLNGVFNVLSTKAGGELIWIPVFTLFSTNSFIDYNAIGGHIPVLGGVAAIGISASILLTIVIPLIDILIRLSAFAVAVWLFWKLLTTYASMLLLIIFSPFFFLAGALPGYESIISNWFKRMAAAALAFPAVVLLMHLALSFMWFSSWWVQIGPGNDPIKVPPPIGSNILNLPYLIGIGILFFATKVPNALQDLFGVKDTTRGGLSAGPLIFAPVSAYTNLTNPRTSPINSIKPITERISNFKIPFTAGRLGANKAGIGIPGAGKLDNLVTSVGNTVFQDPTKRWKSRSEANAGAAVPAADREQGAQGAGAAAGGGQGDTSRPPVNMGDVEGIHDLNAAAREAAEHLRSIGRTLRQNPPNNTPPDNENT